MRTLLSPGRACLLTGLVLASLAHATDWPTIHGNNQRTGYTPDSVTGRYERLWVAEFPNEILSTRVEAIVADGRCFVGTEQGTIWCLDAATGEVLWTRPDCGPFLHSGAYADGTLVIGDARRTLWALKAETGDVLWRYRSGRGGFGAAPLIEAGVIYIGGRDGRFRAVALADGDELWSFDVGAPIRNSAAAGDGRVYVAGENMVAYAFEAETGELAWQSEPMFGQSLRSYYPVVTDGKVIFRTVLTAEMNDDLNGGTGYLAQNAGVENHWEAISDFHKSDRTRGSDAQLAAEQQAILQRLTSNPHRQTFFVFDAATGAPSDPMPVMYAAGCGGCGFPPVVDADGRVILFYRTMYSNWNLGVKPCVGVGTIDLDTGRITPIYHANGNTPPWNTFWGTCDESTVFSVGGGQLYICHQGTLSRMDLSSRRLAPIHGGRDTWGGLASPAWAANEWHGPARGSCAIVEDKLYYVTGSRVICIQGQGGNQ